MIDKGLNGILRGVGGKRPQEMKIARYLVLCLGLDSMNWLLMLGKKCEGID